MRTGRPKGKAGSLQLKMSPEMKAWKNIRARCYCKSSNGWKSYGGRGITVSDKWRYDFAAFFADVGPRPSPLHSLDRIDGNGNYEPGNVRWATAKQQMRNVSSNREVTLNGETMLLCEAVEKSEFNLPYNTILYRLKRGWSLEDALKYPARKGHRPWLTTSPPDAP